MRRSYISRSLYARSQGGFTLIELMIVVAIVAVLAAIGIPSYRQHVMKGNRAAAEAFMQQVANRQEQYVLNARIYTTSLAALKLGVPDNVAAAYNIYVNIPTSVTTGAYYTITAVPTGPQVNDTVCGNLALDQTGTKGAQCTIDTTNNVQLNTSSGGTPTMQCVATQASVCW